VLGGHFFGILFTYKGYLIVEYDYRNILTIYMAKSKSGILSFYVFKYFALSILIIFILLNSCIFTNSCSIHESFDTKVVDADKLIKKIEDKLMKYDKMILEIDSIQTSINNLGLIS
jgi:hypothetical protein